MRIWLFSECKLCSFRKVIHGHTRAPIGNESEIIDFDQFNISVTHFWPANGRTGVMQSGYQLAAFAATSGIALVGGLITGLVLRLPIFDQLNEEVEMFDDEGEC